LKKGTDVICDRFIDSTYAYQGAGKRVPPARIRQLEQWVLGSLKPDLTLIFDLPPEQGLQRAKARGEQNRFEAETLAFMRRVRGGFLARARAEPRRCVIVDARGDVPTVQARLEKIMESRL
jgi:dTMP kinase